MLEEAGFVDISASNIKLYKFDGALNAKHSATRFAIKCEIWVESDCYVVHRNNI